MSAPPAQQTVARLAVTCVVMFATGALMGCESTGTSGSSSSRPRKQLAGPSAAVTFTVEPWTFNGTPGRVYRTTHYNIFTTVQDEEFCRKLPQVMEGGLAIFRGLAPTAPKTERPMDCFVFAQRRDWWALTVQRTGGQAQVYSQIHMGGYTVGDWYAMFYYGDTNTLATAAHEAWHQFTGRHFKSLLPRFIDEGLATQFENIRYERDLPRWNLSQHLMHAQALRGAVDNKKVFPLKQLVTMHAGQVVGLGPERIRAFYAQNWAFARFMLDAEGGKYRPAFDRMIADAVEGKLFPTGSRGQFTDYDPAQIPGMLERYFGLSIDQIDEAYQRYVRVLAFDRFDDQWKNLG